MSNDLLSKEEFIKMNTKKLTYGIPIQPQWSEPKFKCPKCEKGSMRKNLWGCLALTSMPVQYEYEYKCDNEECNHMELLSF